MTPNRDWITITEAMQVSIDAKQPMSDSAIYAAAQKGEFAAEKAGPKAFLIYKPSFLTFLRQRSADPQAAKLYDRLKAANDADGIIAEDPKLIPDLLRYLRGKMA